MSERADVCLACMSRRGPSLCAAACVVSKAGEHESVGQGAVDKIAATRLAPVCYSHRKIVVKTVFIPTDPRPCSPEMLLSTCWLAGARRSHLACPSALWWGLLSPFSANQYQSFKVARTRQRLELLTLLESTRSPVISGIKKRDISNNTVLVKTFTVFIRSMFFIWITWGCSGKNK